MRNRQIRVIGLSLAVLVTLASPGLAWGITIIQHPAQKEPSMALSVSNAIAFYSCYDVRSGAPINCTFTHLLIGIAAPVTDLNNNGGHNHYSGVRPNLLGGRQVEYTADQDPTPLGVSGLTLGAGVPFRGAAVYHPLPEVSGNLKAYGSMTLPFGWHCVSSCFDEISWRFDIVFDVGVGGLEKLTVPPMSNYIVVRGDEATHPDGVYGTPSTLTKLQRIAANYQRKTERQLSVNDISLIKGGLMDFEANWIPPHHSHRRGFDVDINPTDGGGVPIACFQNTVLRGIVEEVAGGAARPLLRCENKSGQFVPPDDPTGIYYHTQF